MLQRARTGKILGAGGNKHQLKKDGKDLGNFQKRIHRTSFLSLLQRSSANILPRQVSDLSNLLLHRSPKNSEQKNARGAAIKKENGQRIKARRARIDVILMT
jgi:hypothetical protein